MTSGRKRHDPRHGALTKEDVLYIKMEEVAGIPRLPESPGVVIYAPLGDTPVEPDVVLFVGRRGRVMLLQEAALRAGVADEAQTIAAANAKLADYHRERRQTLTTG